MELGIFTRTFPGTLDEALDAIAGHGLKCAHLSMASIGVRGLPDELGDDLCATVHEAFRRRGVRLAAVSGTFNTIHPDRAARQQPRTGLGRGDRSLAGGGHSSSGSRTLPESTVSRVRAATAAMSWRASSS